MFKLFRKKVDTQAVIAEIHNEFDTAGERLLNEAKRILSQDVDIDKGERLKKIGFSSTKAVTEAEQILKDKKDSKELAELIEYYGQWYPYNKFITENIVEEICKKYGLLCGDVGRYNGDVPEKNIGEIESFKLREDDMLIRYPYRELQSARFMSNALAQMSSRNMALFSRPSYEEYEERKITPEQWAKEQRYTPTYKICAPEKDFDTRGMMKEGHKLVEIPDPIVLQPVKGGYLIISKWGGDEAADKMVINEKEN